MGSFAPLFLAVTEPSPQPRPSRRAARLARIRIAAAFLAAAVTVGICMGVAGRFPGTYGLPVLLAPGAGAIVGLGIVAALPARTVERPRARRQADLTPRRPWSYGPGWAYGLPAIVALGMVAFLVSAGIGSSSTTDGTFRQVSFTAGDRGSAAGPYPGWYYGLPLIAVTVLLAGVTFLALWRIAAAPRPSDPALAGTDRVLRVYSARIVTKVASAALCVSFAGVLLMASTATGNAVTLNGYVPESLRPAHVLGMAEALMGGMALILGVTLVVLALADARNSPLARPANLGAGRPDGAGAGQPA